MTMYSVHYQMSYYPNDRVFIFNSLAFNSPAIGSRIPMTKKEFEVFNRMKNNNQTEYTDNLSHTQTIKYKIS